MNQEKNKAPPRTKPPELLAPVGDQASLKAALMAGADAVYLGGRRFGARAFASNFDEPGLRWARRVTRSMGRKLYITFNTLVFDYEWPLMEEALDFYEILGPDALIIQDLGVAEVLKQRRSRIPRHLSTQGAWDGLGGEELLKHLGISRVILPRETPLTEIAKLAARSPFEIEIFVHGAMCFSVSGRCFWSAALGTRSGNRGTCAQPCRRSYHDRQNHEAFAFSPRDLRLIDHLPGLANAGIACFKIEGRMKDPDYVYKVVHAYRSVLDGNLTPAEAAKILDETYTRPFHSGFIDGPPKGEWHTPDDPGRQSLSIGTTVGPRRMDGLSEILFCRPLNPGDGLSWEDAEGRKGARITWVETKGLPDRHALVRGLPPLPPNTSLSRSDASGEKPWLTSWNRNWERISIDLFWSGHEDQPLAVETTFAGTPLRITTSATLTRSSGAGLEAGILSERFSLIGEQFQACRHVFGALGKGLFISPSALKKLKRELLETLYGLEVSINPPAPPVRRAEKIVQKPEGFFSEPGSLPHEHLSGNHSFSHEKPRLFIRLWQSRPRPKTRFVPDRWIVPFSFGPPPDGYEPDKLAFWLPQPRNEEEREHLFRALDALPDQEFLCLGWEAFYFARLLPRHHFRLDWTFNIVNQAATRLVTEAGCGVTAAREWPARYPPVNRRVIWPLAINPLVSISRFPKNTIELRDPLTNSHGDCFFRHDIGGGLQGLFLVGKPIGFPAPEGLDLQLDLTVAPGESPAALFSQLELLLGPDLWKPALNR
ncbi:MAG: peptidase U32 family protein [Candidatus Ozemobacteraceae bacterium]